MIINIEIEEVASTGLEKDKDIGATSSKAISKSKMRNKIATKKNRKEKGSRGELMGSNPHS